MSSILSNSEIDAVSKTMFRITSIMIESLNASMKFDVVNTWGYLNPKTGYYDGMAGALQHKHADIGGTTMFMTTDRTYFCDYMPMKSDTGLRFVFRAPPLSYVSNIYYLPFDKTVWICLLCLIIVSTVVIYFTFFARENDANMTPSDVILMSISSVCQMGYQFMTRKMSARISMVKFLPQLARLVIHYVFSLQFCFCFALLFIYTSYTANIVALLQSSAKNIKTVDDLQRSNLEFGIEDMVYSRHYFPTVNDLIRKKFYQTKINVTDQLIWTNRTYGIERMRRGMYAFHMEPGTGYKVVERTFLESEKCGLIEIDFLRLANPWYAIQKDSPYKELIKIQ